MNRIQELESQIRYHNDLYWNGKDLEISDIEYDNLVRELSELDPENELLTSFGKSESVKKIKHSKPMLSLGKVYSIEDLMKWVKKVARTKDELFLIQPKYDGMSGLLENGTLSSRGDGINGEDYTNKLQIIEFDTDHIVDLKHETLLGEILISNKQFNTIYKNIKGKSGVPFKNQRNGIAGILGTDAVSFYANQGAKITFVDYNTHSEVITASKIEKEFESIANEIRENSGYPLDGIVIKLKDKTYSESLGYTTHHPRGQVAYKFTNQNAQSKLIGIEWGMGKQQISAIGLIEPVEISGTTIKRVKLQLTKPKSTSVTTCLIDGSLQIGDNIVVERAGDIIPHIVSSTPGTIRKEVIIDKCPFCGGKVQITDTSISCLNPNCKEKIIQNLYCSIVTLGFKNVGEAYIRMLVNDSTLNVRTIDQLFALKIEDLKAKAYGTKMKEIFFGEIEKAKANCTKDQLIACLNIENVGKTVSKLLVERFTWEDILLGNFEGLSSIEGIGPTIQISILSNLNSADKDAKRILLNLVKMFKLEEKKEEKKDGALTICFTGKMEHKRSEMEDIARKKGFIPMDHVDKTLNILVCADPNSGSGKLQKAAKYGTKIISEADFMAGNF